MANQPIGTSSMKRFALLQPGFFFSPGQIFSVLDATRIYAVLLGSDANTLTKAEVKARGAEVLAILFRAVVDQSAVFRALRGNTLVWQMVVNRATLFDDIAIDDAKLVVEKMAAAREAYENKAYPQTELTQLVDQYIALRDATIALGPPATFVVSQRVNPSGSSSNAPLFNSLAATLGSLSFSGTWPPPQFVLGDLSVLSHPHVKASLAYANNAGHTPTMAGALSMPRDLVVSTAKIAVDNYLDASPWALFLPPVAFNSGNQRREWYLTTGHQARLFGTWDAFLNYAKDAFQTRGKKMVMGMAMYWQGSPEDFQRLANVYKADGREVWESSNFLQRHATLVILRRCEDDTVQIIWYDPWYWNEAIKDRFKARSTAIYNWRAGVVERLVGWAEANNTQIHSRYWGGGNITGVQDNDSVKESLTFLEMLASGRFILPEDHAGLKTLGYVRTE